MRGRVCAVIGLLFALSALAGARVHRHVRHPQSHVIYHASAYTKRGLTASGRRTRPGIVAADPHVLPIGSRIRVRGAGRRSGVYTVADTGPRIRGRRIDIFMNSHAEARKFGRRPVKVEVLHAARKRRRGVGL